MRLLLDTTILGMLCHPKAHADVKDWVSNLIINRPDVTIGLPEVCDYELRRKLLHLVATQKAQPDSVARLDAWVKRLDYLPLTTKVMREAAALWAEARCRGYPTADKKALDGDVILSAQAKAPPAIVVTSNRKHIACYGVVAKDWTEIDPASPSAERPVL